MKLRLHEIVDREGDIKEFRFTPDKALEWKAGQYMHYVLPHDNADDRGTERWFTNSAAPSEHEIRITTRISHEHSSSFKRALQTLKPGDTIEADGPEGDFIITDTTRNYLFIVGGIGITPIRSMLTELDLSGQKLKATILYANRNNEVPFREQLEELQSKNPGFKIDYVIDPDRIDETRLKNTIESIDKPLVYISGPEPMVKSLSTQIESLGVDRAVIKLDDFPGYENI